jgi:hypothetical protein
MKSPNVFKALEDFQQVRDHLDPSLFVVALAASLGAAFITSALYRHFYERRGTGSQVHRAFPLLGISITTLFIAVQLSIPLSLGLLGALSIIRFRTPIKEPEEVGFIMLLIASSVSAATFNFVFMGLLLVVAVIALLLVRSGRNWKAASRDGVLVLQLTDSEAASTWPQIQECLKTHLRRTVMESSSSRDGQTSLHLAFAGLKSSVTDLQTALRAVAPIQNINVFLDRPGGLR